MVRKTIKVKFMGFADYHRPQEQSYYHFLSNRYQLVESETPDYIIDGGQTFHHVRYDCIKILINSENVVPDFNFYDYAVGSTEMTFGDRYVRVPWFAFYPYFADIVKRRSDPDSSLLNRKFCSFVVSNAEFGDPMRKKFFEALSKYKRVDSGGRYMNNVGGAVSDKLKFCRDYKFNIAFENSSCRGYTTEKIMEAYVAQTVPIYYGNPNIEADFRADSMVRVMGEDDIGRAVEEIIRLDQDDAAYMRMVTARCLAVDAPDVYEKRLEEFLVGVFDQPLDRARRLCPYGHQAMLRQHLNMVHGADQRLRDMPGYGLAVGALAKIRAFKRRAGGH